MRDETTFLLDPVPPFRLDLTVWTLRRRPENQVDRWDGQTYRRVLAWGDDTVALAVTQVGTANAPHLRVTLNGAPVTPEIEAAAREVVTRTLGLQVDLTTFYHAAAKDARLEALAQRFRGVKPPRFPSVFEALANAIACQQITLTQGIRLLNWLVQTCGMALGDGDTVAHAFPRPEDMAGRTPEELRPLGFSTTKGRALIELARACADGEVDLEGLAELDDGAALARLLPLYGIGRWSAEYVLLRGLGRTHIFPGDDVGARGNLQRWLARDAPLDYRGVQQALADWTSYGGLIYFHLLLDRLAQAGYLCEAT